VEFKPTAFSTDVGDSWREQYTRLLIVFFAVSAPALLGVVAGAVWAGSGGHSRFGWFTRPVFAAMRAVDQMGDWKLGGAVRGRPVHWEGTELGGICSLLAIALIAGLASALVTAFKGPENIRVASFVLPFSAAGVEDYERGAFFTLPARVDALPTLSRGVAVSVAAQGPDCGAADGWEDARLTDGEWAHTSNVDNATLTWTHTFGCTDCVFSQFSRLALSFPGTCQSLALLVGAVSAKGAVKLFSLAVEPPGVEGTYLESVSLPLTLTLDVVRDRSLLPSGVSRMPPAPAQLATLSRGWLFEPAPHAVVYTPAGTAGPPSTVEIALTTQLADTFTGTEFVQIFYYLDLMYQLAATLAFGGLFTLTFLFIIERYKRLELFRSMVEAEELAAAVMGVAGGAHCDSVPSSNGAGLAEAVVVESARAHGRSGEPEPGGATRGRGERDELGGEPSEHARSHARIPLGYLFPGVKVDELERGAVARAHVADASRAHGAPHADSPRAARVDAMPWSLSDSADGGGSVAIVVVESMPESSVPEGRVPEGSATEGGVTKGSAEESSVGVGTGDAVPAAAAVAEGMAEPLVAPVAAVPSAAEPSAAEPSAAEPAAAESAAAGAEGSAAASCSEGAVVGGVDDVQGGGAGRA